MALTPKLFLKIHIYYIKLSFMEVYKSDKLEFESETLANSQWNLILSYD